MKSYSADFQLSFLVRKIDLNIDIRSPFLFVPLFRNGGILTFWAFFFLNSLAYFKVLGVVFRLNDFLNPGFDRLLELEVLDVSAVYQ